MHRDGGVFFLGDGRESKRWSNLKPSVVNMNWILKQLILSYFIVSADWSIFAARISLWLPKSSVKIAIELNRTQTQLVVNISDKKETGGPNQTWCFSGGLYTTYSLHSTQLTVVMCVCSVELSGRQWRRCILSGLSTTNFQSQGSHRSQLFGSNRDRAEQSTLIAF